MLGFPSADRWFWNAVRSERSVVQPWRRLETRVLLGDEGVGEHDGDSVGGAGWDGGWDGSWEVILVSGLESDIRKRGGKDIWWSIRVSCWKACLNSSHRILDSVWEEADRVFYYPGHASELDGPRQHSNPKQLALFLIIHQDLVILPIMARLSQTSDMNANADTKHLNNIPSRNRNNTDENQAERKPIEKTRPAHYASLRINLSLSVELRGDSSSDHLSPSSPTAKIVSPSREGRCCGAGGTGLDALCEGYSCCPSTGLWSELPGVASSSKELVNERISNPSSSCANCEILASSQTKSKC